ncbi:MAG: hypothetical protein A2Z45_04240 [Chloroflexi bacterium RBG_19FT_COMBO_55_16]|nr:MAG: hypothetical protein A2Z45_04240 [Chloroflexi bacterium RBG_19FT_COMBO_55_16]
MTRDLRRYANQTNIRLILGGLLLLFLVGDGLIYIFYGNGAAIMGLICLALGLLPLIIIWVMLWGIEWLARKANRE